MVVEIANPARTLLVRGAVAVAFGVLTLIWPTVTVLALAIVFGVYALIDGVMRIVGAIRDHERPRRWVALLSGAVSVAAGIISLIWPGITVLVLALLVGVWALVTGVTDIVAAIRLRKQIRGEVFLVLIGLLSVVAGVLIIFQPIAGALGIALVIGVFAVLYGAVLIYLGYRLRKLVNA
jgi:uncharacterized membrane protein HdeD (DUF308 family)